jgi:hypothetical protein
MKVLIACEFSGIVRDAFIAKGHDAMSCDLLPTEKPGPHYQGDVMDIINDGWDLMIAFDPCTYQCNSGVRWLFDEQNIKKTAERWDKMRESCYFTLNLLDCGIEKICRENPIPHKYALDIIGRKYNQIIQPWQFGHGETKATCLWLKNLPPLKPTNIVEGRNARVHKEPPSKERWKNRSRTYQGIANAMAEQWSVK